MSTVRNWATGFYWIGVAMALACVASIVAGNTDLVWRLQHTGFPLSWALAGVALSAFVAFEFCDRSAVPCEAEDQDSQVSVEWETAEF